MCSRELEDVHPELPLGGCRCGNEEIVALKLGLLFQRIQHLCVRAAGRAAADLTPVNSTVLPPQY